LLPPPVEAVPEKPKPDLTKLSRKQLDDLEHLMAIAHGVEPSTKARARELAFEQMFQYEPARALALLCAAGDARPDGKFTNDERAKVVVLLTEALPRGETVAPGSAWVRLRRSARCLPRRL
jgi:hypothetical protein